MVCRRVDLIGYRPRQQFGDPIDRMVGEALDDGTQTSLLVDAVELGRADQAIDGCGAFAARLITRKQEVLRRVRACAQMSGGDSDVALYHNTQWTDPAAWLRDTLEKLPRCPNSQIDSLLPLRPELLSQAHWGRLGAWKQAQSSFTPSMSGPWRTLVQDFATPIDRHHRGRAQFSNFEMAKIGFSPDPKRAIASRCARSSP